MDKRIQSNKSKSKEAVTPSSEPDVETTSDSTFSNIPESGIPKFVGREQNLRDIHSLLTIDSPPQRVAVVGMGGLGKNRVRYSVC